MSWIKEKINQMFKVEGCCHRWEVTALQPERPLYNVVFTGEITKTIWPEVASLPLGSEYECGRPVDWSASSKPLIPSTLLLSRCARCDKADVQLVLGEWTGEELAINSFTERRLMQLKCDLVQKEFEEWKEWKVRSRSMT